MKAHLLTVAALAVLVSGPTFAEDAYGFPPVNDEGWLPGGKPYVPNYKMPRPKAC